MAKVLDHDTDHRGTLDLNKKELRNPRLQNLGADIGSPVDGLFFYRSDTNKVRVRINGAWQDLATMADVTAGGISSAIVDAKGDLITATAADTVVREAVGADGTIYFADSAQGTGHIWRVLATSDLSNGIVTLAKMANLAASTLLGNNTGGATAPIALTPAQVKTLLAIVAADISDFNTAVRTNRLDQLATPTASVAFGSQKITGLADGVAATDAITLQQLNAAVEGRIWKDPVDAMTTAALPALTYSSAAGTLTANANAALAAQDGVTLAVGDTLLVKDQASTFQNGIYSVTQVGSGAAPFILTRVAEASTATELRDATVLVGGGTTGAGDIYTQTVSTLADLTAATQTWTKTGEGNTVYAADGTTLTLSGTTFSINNGGVGATQLAAAVAGNGLAGGAGTALSVNTDGTTIELNSDAVRIAATAAGAGLTGGGGSALAVGAGTGISVAADSVALDTAVAVRKFAADCAAATSTVVTHNLNTRDVTVSVYRTTTPWDEVSVEVEHTSVNTVTVRFTIAPAAGDYRIVVHG